jgi:hypothetical protein
LEEKKLDLIGVCHEYEVMQKRTFLIIVAFATCVFLFCAPKSSDAKVIDLESPIYDKLDQLYLEAGLAFPSGSRPWSVSEARMILKRLEPYSLGSSYEELERELCSNDQEYLLGLSLKVSPEAYYHANTDDFDMSSDWNLGFSERQPFVRLALELGIENSLYSYCDMGYGWGLATYKDEIKSLQEAAEQSGHSWIGVGAIIDPADGDKLTVTRSWVYSQAFLFNFPDIRMIEISVPRRSLFSLGNEHLLFSFSRDRISWGTASIGNFVLDDHVSYQNYIRLKGFTDRLSLDLVVLFMDCDPGTSWASDGGTKKEYYLLHRLEYRPAGWLSLALSENVMYKCTVPSLEFFNLSYFLHQLNNSQLFNAIASAEIDAALFKGARAYAQFCLDQATAPTESNKQAPAYGWLAGLTFTKGDLTANVEYAYASPCLYRRDLVDFLMYQKQNINVYCTRPIFVDSIGFPYFGDSQALEASLSYKGLEGLSASLSARLVRKGILDIYTSHSSTNDNSHYPDIKDASPYGDRFFDTLDLKARLDFDAGYILGHVQASAFFQIDWISKKTVEKQDSHIAERAQDLQLCAGVSFSI